MLKKLGGVMKTKTVEKLISLVQLDIDAVDAYKQALKNIDNQEIHKNLNGFLKDHLRHIKELSEVIEKLGGEPPEKTPDIKGFFIKGFTAIRSLTGTIGAIKAMRGNEKLTTKTYKEALSDRLPNDVKDIVKRNYADEIRHLEYIESVLEQRNQQKNAA